MKLAKVFKENKQFTLFSILALVVVGVAVFAPQIAPYDPLDAVMLEIPSGAKFCTSLWNRQAGT